MFPKTKAHPQRRKSRYPGDWLQWDSPSTFGAELDKTGPWLQMLLYGHPHGETSDKGRMRVISRDTKYLTFIHTFIPCAQFVSSEFNTRTMKPTMQVTCHNSCSEISVGGRGIYLMSMSHEVGPIQLC